MGFFGNGKRIPDGQCSGFSMTTIPGNVLRLPHVPPTELDSIADQAGLLPVLNGMGSYYFTKNRRTHQVRFNNARSCAPYNRPAKNGRYYA